MKRLIFTLFTIIFALSPLVRAQTDSHRIEWNASTENPESSRFNFAGTVMVNNKAIPVFFLHRQSSMVHTYTLQNVVSTPVQLPRDYDLAIREALDEPITVYRTREGGQHYENIEVIPFRINPMTNGLERMASFDLKVITSQANPSRSSLGKRSNFSTSSVLSNGVWRKFKIAKEGIYRLDVSALKSANVDPKDIDASTFRIYGNPGGLLPEPNDLTRPDDLQELAIEVVDENNNNRLDGNDHILFYAEHANRWLYNDSEADYLWEQNVYENNNFVFLTHSQGTGRRLAVRNHGQGSPSDTTISGYRKRIHHEVDAENFITSGRDWWGESFKNQNQKTFGHTISDVRTDENIILRSRFGVRSIQANSSYNLKLNGSTVDAFNFSGVSGDYDANFMTSPRFIEKSLPISSGSINLSYTFISGSSGSDAWLDYYDLSVPADLHFSNGQFPIYLPKVSRHPNVKLVMSGDFRLWDVTDYQYTSDQLTFEENGNQVAIFATGSVPRHLIAFTPGTTMVPEFIGTVENQNLHALMDLDYAIIAPSNFKSQANELASFHRDYYHYSVEVISLNQIYNEFGGGKADATAIRDFLRMLYERGQTGSKPFRFALLFGDGSYDYKDRIDNNTNYVPTFQSRESISPSYSYGSDDYYGMLDADEGYFDVLSAKEGLDIGVGRIPCRTTEQAQTIVNKIKRYHEITSFGEWRIRQTYVADDEDNNTHFRDSEKVSGYVDAQNRMYNLQKIYIDAFEQQSFGSGQKYPDVNVAIDRSFDRGHVIFNYLGHGGPSGMAHERIVTRDQIRNWSNIDKLPVIITATCELTRYDDPSQDSPGELALFNDHGGAVGLITTTRLVFINLNRDLNEQVQNQNMFDLDNGFPTLGDVFMKAKNNSQKNVNQRNFSLIGDPGMQLAYPKLNVVTTSINDSIIGVNALDTFRAFSKVKVTGEIHTANGQLASDFNGVVFPTMFDKYLKYSTLGNDLASKSDTFNMQNSVLYRGLVSVVNGKFSFQFVVPKDIAYHYGYGKISYYAHNNVIDAAGYETGVIIGGSESDIANDTTGPEISLFMDDESFIFGGMTDKEPLLLCKVFDANGINTVGNGIGRDITAILDEGTPAEQILVLNDYYQSTLDSYQAGEIRYPMEELPVGKHTLKIRVWDVYNNVAEDYTEFIVGDDADLAITHVLNYPNPFSTHTTFHFDHNREGQQMDVMIQIMTITGKVVKTLHYSSPSVSSHFDNIEWNGRDEYGDRLGRGVYLYKITAKAEDGSTTDAVEKLVLLK